MRKFVIKCTIIPIGVIIIIFVKVYFSAEKFDFTNIPENNVSNSPSYKAKLDHAISNDNFKKCSFLVFGSSMSLNNISGEIIQNRTQQKTYNISSWGTKVEQITKLFKVHLFDERVKYVLVAFNNVDFNVGGYEIDYQATNNYINGNSFDRLRIFLHKLRINTFIEDCNFRNGYSKIRNVYASVFFDKNGSVLLDHKGFEISTDRWKSYNDTTGFEYFFYNINKLNEVCKANKIQLYLVYLPYRNDLLTIDRIKQNAVVSTRLSHNYKSNFINLSNLKVPANYYCDGSHFFKEGADYVTNIIIDSLQLRNRQLDKYTNIKKFYDNNEFSCVVKQ